MTQQENESIVDADTNHHNHNNHCMVCYSDLKEHAGILPCGHNEVCGVCHLRLRHLHKDQKCPMCKAPHEKIIVGDASLKKFEDYPMWGNELGSEFVFREDVGMFFKQDYYQTEILPLFGMHCTVKQCPYDGVTPEENIHEDNKSQQQQNHNRGKKKEKTPLRQLQDHLRNKHRLTLCNLCVDFKRDFISQLPRFTPNQLKNHSARGDGAGSGFKGHPVCEFCRPKRFYDLTQLHQHLNKEHYKCHVCEKMGRHNQFFRNYESLQRHFDKEHFLCRDAQCLAARFVVFENEIDLRGHELSTHGGTSTGSTKIQLEFRVRRAGHDGAGVAQNVPTDQDFSYGVDGQAFVPEELPSQQQQQDELSSGAAVSNHPQHVARTAEIRAHAERIRQQSQMEQQQQQDDEEEAFPSLNSQNDSGGALRVGWSSGDGLRAKNRIGEVTPEQFPSLPKASSTKKNSIAAKMRAKPVARGGAAAARSSTAAAISAASWGGGGGSTAAAAAPSRAPTFSSSAFPPPSFGSAPSHAASRNRESNLHPNNFPSLGGGSAPRYAAAEAFSKKNKQEKKGVSLSDLNDFPPPPSASSASNNQTIKKKMLGNSQKAPSKQALDNVLKFPPPQASSSLAEGKATTEHMKASLGPSKYKRLKALTKSFALDEISPASYVDQTAALFDTGYADPDFWSFVPSLLESCPNESSSQEAIRYMKQLRVSTPHDDFVSSSGNALGRASLSRPSSHPVYSATLAKPAGKKQGSAWNAGSGAAKAAPGKVAALAAAQTPQSGTATKFMAKEKKQQKQAAQQPGKKKSEKKKERDELRALAFGS